MVTYSESGVDIDLEAVTVSKLADKLKSTLSYRDIITDSGHYAALVKLGDKAIAMSTDGVGSKILIAEMMNKYDTVGIDCIAMVVNDILCVGAEPIALVDYLAVEKPDPQRAAEIAEGLVKGANESNIAIIRLRWSSLSRKKYAKGDAAATPAKASTKYFQETPPAHIINKNITAKTSAVP